VVKSTFLCGGSALAVAISLFGTETFAADVTASAAATQPGAVVGELVVVAQKREQNIESVPVAITAFSGKQRDVLNLKTTQDLSNFTPGLSYYSVTDEAYIRGIGRNTVALATAAGVATYYNGIYYGANATIAIQKDSLFIGNVEVDNGPQNTLHGSNADGGVINYVSNKPTSSYYAEARAGVGNYGYIWGEAVVSGPINDHWKFRVGGNYSNEGGGYFTNLEGGQSPGGGSGPQGNGGRWHYWEAQLQGNYDHFDVWGMISSGGYNTNYNTNAQVGNIPEYEFFNATLSPSGFFGLCALDGNTGVGCTTTTQRAVPGSVKVVGGGVLANQFPGNNPANVNPYNRLMTFQPSNQQNNDLAIALTATYHFPGLDVEYLGGYQTFNYNLHFEGSATDAGIFSYGVSPAGVAPSAANTLTIFPSGEFTYFFENDQYFSNELDFISTAKGPLQYLFGAYEYHEHFDQPVGAGCYPNQPQDFAPLGGPANPSGCLFQTDGHVTYDDVAGFAHASYDITPQWQFAGGVRYTWDNRYGYQQQRILTFDQTPGFRVGDPIPGFGVPWGPLTPSLDVTAAVDNPKTFPAVPGAAGPVINNKVTGFAYRTIEGTWSAVTGDATINWKPDSSTLGYLRYARGYKAGGLNTAAFTLNPQTGAETVDDFEGGIKKTWGSALLINADIFYYNWYNDQQPIAIEQGGTLINVLFNIPQSQIYGFEGLAQWRPVDPLTLSLTYDYEAAKIIRGGGCVEDPNDPQALTVRASLKNGCPLTATGVQTISITGNTLPQVPANKVAFNAQYAFHFEPGTLTLSGTFVWKDATFDDVFNDPLSKAPAYDEVNFSAYWEDSKDRYTLIAYIDNAFNALAYDFASQNLLSPAGVPYSLAQTKGLVSPLTFGGEVQVRFR
jgi:iron complex outermembrane receptor protein